MQEKNYFLVNFIVRVILGVGVIFFGNQFFAYQEIPLEVGINAISVVTSGVLGLPGVALLYGITALPIL